MNTVFVAARPKVRVAVNGVLPTPGQRVSVRPAMLMPYFSSSEESKWLNPTGFRDSVLNVAIRVLFRNSIRNPCPVRGRRRIRHSVFFLCVTFVT